MNFHNDTSLPTPRNQWNQCDEFGEINSSRPNSCRITTTQPQDASLGGATRGRPPQPNPSTRARRKSLPNISKKSVKPPARRKISTMSISMIGGGGVGGDKSGRKVSKVKAALGSIIPLHDHWDGMFVADVSYFYKESL